MSHRWKCYTIMHKDRKVASVRADGTCTIYACSFMPYSLYLEDIEDADMDTRLNNLQNFYHWCASRVLTLDRKYAKEILNSIGQKQSVTDQDRAQIAIAYHGLSLTDVYWIKADGENVCFDEINLYEHSLSDAFVDVSLRGKQLTIENSSIIEPGDIAGDVATTGVSPKAWVRRDGDFYLLKDGDKSEVDAELLASLVAQCFDVAQVIYEPYEYDGEIVTKSKLITSIDRSIVAMEHIEIYAVNNEMNYMEMVRDKDSYGFHMMNIVDYLVGNTDRHWGNWGFSVDNDNNRLGHLHPLMDFNRAFTSYDTIDGAASKTVPGASQRQAAIEAVKAVGLNQIKPVRRAWFDDEEVWKMFSARLEILKEHDSSK